MFYDYISNTLIFFVEKMREAVALQKCFPRLGPEFTLFAIISLANFINFI